MINQGISTDEMMKTLSDDAKSMLGGFFGTLGIPGRSSISFGMKQSRPTARAEAAFAECVKAGALTRKDMHGGGVEYVVQVNCADFGRWLNKNRKKGAWSSTEPIPTTTPTRKY